MGVTLVLLIIVGLGATIFIQSAARQQVSVWSSLPPDEASRVIERYCRVVWSRVSGPGDFNYRIRMRAYPATLSIDCASGHKGGTQVDMWVGEATTKFGFMGHAMLMWRKKRGLAKKLARGA